MPAPGWRSGPAQPSPFGQLVAAVSVGVVEGELRLDLAYAEDKDAGVDSNIVMVEPAEFVEVQGTGEHATFTRGQLEALLDLAERGIAELFQAQRQVLAVKLLAATRSLGKQREIRRILAPTGIEIVFPDDIWLRETSAGDALELAQSFEANARRKAEYFARLSSLPTFADDSGLEVFSLGGAPGRALQALGRCNRAPAEVDAANNAELLRRLAGAPEETASRSLSLCAGLLASRRCRPDDLSGRLHRPHPGGARGAGRVRLRSALLQ